MLRAKPRARRRLRIQNSFVKARVHPFCFPDTLAFYSERPWMTRKLFVACLRHNSPLPVKREGGCLISGLIQDLGSKSYCRYCPRKNPRIRAGWNLNISRNKIRGRSTVSKARTSPKLGGCKNCMELWLHCPHLWQSHPQRGAFHSSPFLARQRALPVFEHLDQVLK